MLFSYPEWEKCGCSRRFLSQHVLCRLHVNSKVARFWIKVGIASRDWHNLTNDMSESENPMARTSTKAAKVRRTFRTVKPRTSDLVYDIENAVMAVRALFVEIRNERSQAGIDQWWDDVAVALILMTPEKAKNDVVYLLPISRDFEDLAIVYKDAMQLKKTEGVVPLGAAFWQLDQEAGGEVDVWVEQWLTGPRAMLAADRASKAFEESGGKGTNANFGKETT